MPSLRIIDEKSLASALADLCVFSPQIRMIVQRYGAPPAWRREPGFASLVYTILEQQVSLASARAVYERLVALVGDLNPASFYAIDEEGLRSIGFSRQKTAYCRGLADNILSGRFDLESLNDAPDQAVRRSLIELPGIGPWTADIYLLHSLGRPDVWPVGDLALRIAVQEELDLVDRPKEEELRALGEAFKPWRSIAARVFWHGYLIRRGIREVT